MSDVYANSGQASGQYPQPQSGGPTGLPSQQSGVPQTNGQIPVPGVAEDATAVAHNAPMGGNNLAAPSAADTPADVARAILMDPDFSPHGMSDRFWRFRQEHLRQTYGIDIK